MKKILSACLLAAYSGPAFAQELKIGQWEVTIKSEMTGIPVPPQSRKITYCVTEKTKNQPFVGNESCRFGDKIIQGNKVSWKMTCDGDPQLSGEITQVIENDRYSGMSNMILTMPGAPNMTMKGTYEGRYLGPLNASCASNSTVP